MRTLRTIAELRTALRGPRAAGVRIGLVPTMGAFHDGHLSLMRRAREECGLVVVSLFVNPAQFNEGGDLESYPRDEQRDASMAAEAGVDLLFAPDAEEVYPPGFATTVSVSGITEVLEGAHRGRAHFDGVATVVTKLLNIAAPEIAYFGQKDAQQALVIGRLVRDLNIDVEIEICPTVREHDGLAMSSRNVRLGAGERQQALALTRSLQLAARRAGAGATETEQLITEALSELEHAGVQTEYFQIVNSQTLEPITRLNGPALAVVAARVGNTRLIDNQQLTTHTDRLTTASNAGASADVSAAGSQ